MEDQRSYDFEAGEVLLIDKPYKWTSFDIIKKLRGILRIKKIGHAGTLDPLATGLLIVCTGKATKKINEFQNYDKTYSGTIVLGKTTPSYDLETEFDSELGYDSIIKTDLDHAAKQLTGDLMQTPPVYSAIKVDGKRAYKKARNKENIVLKPRAVTVSQFDLTEIDLPEVRFEISCSKGTYIRSLAHDFGQILGCGAYLGSLQRTSVGPYKLDDANQIADFEKFRITDN